MKGRIIATAVFLILGLGIAGFGVFGIMNEGTIVNVAGQNFNFEGTSLWVFIAIIFAGLIICYWAFKIWRGLKTKTA